MLPNEGSSPRSVKKSKSHTVAPTSPTFRRSENIRYSGRRGSAVHIKNNKWNDEVSSNDEDFTPPNPELAARIVEQVEFYFSDVNIMKDTFLLQHMKHNREGYISLKLLSGFKRIKHLVKNWRELAHALENGSELLQLNNERTKIRRLAPLPTYDSTSPSRTVIALDLPLEKPITIKSVANIFAPCGRIVLVRILLPKNPIPADIRPYVSEIPDLQAINDACALVEFADADGVQCALQRRPACAQAAPLLWGCMRVSPLISQTEDGFARNSHRASFQGPIINPVPPASPVPRQDYGSRRHSCPIIQYTPIARRRVSVTIPENVIRLPKGPDGTRGFRDRSDLSSSD